MTTFIKYKSIDFFCIRNFRENALKPACKKVSNTCVTRGLQSRLAPGQLLRPEIAGTILIISPWLFCVRLRLWSLYARRLEGRTTYRDLDFVARMVPTSGVSRWVCWIGGSRRDWIGVGESVPMGVSTLHDER
jgi:hypothetical protein